MLRAVLVVLGVGLTVYALIDCVRTEPHRVRTLPKSVWLLVVVLLPVLGPIAWLVSGRAPRGPGPVRRRPGPVAPDDDPEFLRELERRRRSQAQDEQLRRWEQEARGAGQDGSGAPGGDDDGRDRPDGHDTRDDGRAS